MKKLLKLITMLFLASAMVISCGGGSGSDVPSTSDCTEIVSTSSDLKLSDGEWTVYMNATADFLDMKMELEATVKDRAYEFTSGEASATVDMEKIFELMGDEMDEGMGMTEEELEQFKNLSDKQKNSMTESILEQEIGGEIPVDYDISWDDLKLKVKVTASGDDFAKMEGFLEAEMEDVLDINSLPADAEIKTNGDKTKYTINFGFEDEDVGTLNVEIKAIKK